MRFPALSGFFGVRRSGANDEAPAFGFFDQGDPVFLIGLEPEPGGGGNDPLDGGKLFRDESRHLLEGIALDHHEEVVPAAHQIAALDLRKLGDSLGESIKTAAAFWSDFDLDAGSDCMTGCDEGIKNGLVAEDHAIGLQLCNFVPDIRCLAVEFFGEVFNRYTGVVAQERQQRVHKRVGKIRRVALEVIQKLRCFARSTPEKWHVSLGGMHF